MYFFMFAEFSSFRSIYDLHMEKIPKQKAQGLHKFPRWWFQPIWKICTSNWIISPNTVGMNIKNIWVATTQDSPNIYPAELLPLQPNLGRVVISYAIRLTSAKILFSSALIELGSEKGGLIRCRNPTTRGLFTGNKTPESNMPISQEVTMSTYGIRVNSWWSWSKSGPVFFGPPTCTTQPKQLHGR